MAFQLHCQSRTQHCGLSQNVSKASFLVKENHFSVCCYFSTRVLVSVTLRASTCTSEDRILNSKQQQINTATTSKLILGPDLDGDMYNPVTCDGKEKPVTSQKDIKFRSRDEAGKEVCARLPTKKKKPRKILSVMALLPHTSADTSVWRKQTSVQTPGLISTVVINQQQTKCLHFLDMTEMNSLSSDCMWDKND